MSVDPDPGSGAMPAQVQIALPVQQQRAAGSATGSRGATIDPWIADASTSMNGKARLMREF